MNKYIIIGLSALLVISVLFFSTNRFIINKANTDKLITGIVGQSKVVIHDGVAESVGLNNWSLYPAKKTLDMGTNGITLGGASRTNWPITDTNYILNSIGVVQSNLNAEVDVRGIADTNLNNSIGTVQSNLNTEVDARGIADTNLNNLIVQVQSNLDIASNSFNNTIGATQTNLQNQINGINNSLIMKLGTGTIVYSNLYYLASGSIWTNANASTNLTSRGLLGLALGSSISTNGLLINGLFSNVWNFSSGSIIYAGTNNNSLTTTMPTTAGNIVRIIGYVVDINNIYFNPDRSYIELSP